MSVGGRISFWPLGTLMMYGFEPWVEKPVLRRARALVMKSWGFLLMMGNLSFGCLKIKVPINIATREQRMLKGESRTLMVAEMIIVGVDMPSMLVRLFYLNESRRSRG